MLEEIWPKSKRSIEIGSHKFQTATLCSYDKHEMNNLENKYLPGPCGGYLLKFRAQGVQSFVDVYSNDGSLHSMTSCVNAVSCSKVDIRNAFWCNNGYVGLLDYKGNVIIMTISGERVSYFPLGEKIERVAADYPFPGGIAFYTEYPFNFYVFEFSSQTSYPLCKEAKFEKPATAVCYGGGKGFVAYTDSTMAIVTDTDITPINKFDFTPYIMVMSPHNSLIAVRDDYNLYIRSTNSSQAFPPFGTGKETKTLGDIAFLDETTVSVIVKEDGVPTCYTFQQGQLVTPEFFSGNAKIYHLIQDYESVRVYRTASEGLNEFFELNILTPIHDTILDLLKKPFIDQLELLIQAKRYFDSENIDSYKILEELKGKDKEHDQLGHLIHMINEAAPHILDINAVELILKYAAFAKYLAAGFNHDEFANTVKTVRVLNNLRKYEHFVTVMTDFDNTEKSEFLSSIVQLKKYELAERIARQYGLNRSVIAENWAIDVFSTHRRPSDPEYANYSTAVIKHLARFDQVNYLRVAEMAIFYGLSETDIKSLISLISDPQVRMNFILKNHQIYRDRDDALKDVINSKDGNAIISYLCIQRDTLPSGFGTLLTSSPVLQEHYSSFKQQQFMPDGSMGYQKVIGIENYHPVKKFQLELIYGPRAYNSGFALKPEQLRKAKNIVGGGSIWSQCIDNQIVLIGEMVNLGWTPPQATSDPSWKPPPTRSARYCMEKAVLDGKEAVFKKIAKTFNINNTVQCWIRVKTLAKNGKWEELEQMSKKSQAIEWEDIADVCAENGNLEKALVFIEKISNSDKKIEMLLSYKFDQRALEVAKQSKNTQKYNEILSRMG